ncbi:MAG: flagellar hook protein FlgE [Campylobacterota bacterium]|nr:flagellar hook protein FlgE [Campylobacterota bacterium]
MLKSLFSGVSGLQSHQVAMDVESNNIANVNTVGFKYSRANFSDLLAQTRAIATAPQGQLGGKNPVQVGLGSSVSSMTRIFAQGSIQNSDKNTDVAIQGDGFLIISPDGGNTYKYTRAGDLKFDAGGNFVDNNGYISQGWLRDPVTGQVDSTAPITNINIPPGLTTPASATAEIVLKANLNSGPLVESFSPAYEISSTGGTLEPAAVSNGVAVNSGDIGVMYNPNGERFDLQEGQGVWISYTESISTGHAAVGGGTAGTAMSIVFNVDQELSEPANQVTINAVEGATAADSARNLAAAVNARTSITGISAIVTAGDALELRNNNSSDAASHNINIASQTGNTGIDVTQDVSTAERYLYTEGSGSNGVGIGVFGSQTTFNTMAELRNFIQEDARSLGAIPGNNGITVVVNSEGQIEIGNPNSTADDYNLNMQVTGYSSHITGSTVVNNSRFTNNMAVLNTSLTAGSTRTAYTQAFNSASHSSSIDVFDSLGSKHTIRMEFRKVGMTDTYSEWDMIISSPITTDLLNGVGPYNNEIHGHMRFNPDGSLLDPRPTFVELDPNNGAALGQHIDLSFGSIGSFDGMTSFDNPSATSGISQDGYTGGDLVGIRIDQSGTLVGSFSNGRSFGLAQIAMAKFTNNEGLSTEGGNVFIQTANSGDPIIGTAATAGRGFIQSSALEASNVDLSRALTQLIIIQRGFQANGKTITTSDQLLETLIGLKR